jgi:photosystem II stability/assembly factor-like uncharacterized protein
MKDRILAIGLVVVISLSGLFSLTPIVGGNTPMALAAPGRAAPTVTAIEPNEAPNDLDITVVISGEGFEETPTVYLGETALTDVVWVSETELSAVVPWGMDPGVYALTVENPAGETSTLAGAFTVTQGIGVWASGGPYGGGVGFITLGDEQGEIVYAIVGNVGLFRSRNGGESWELIFIEIGHESKVAVDTNNPNKLYIAKIGVSEEKSGLYKSENGGDTWIILPKPYPGIDNQGFYPFINPHNSTLYGALFVSPNHPNWEGGLFRFDDINQSWIRLEEEGLLDQTTPVSAVGFSPEDQKIMFASLVGGRILQSLDGGNSWSLHSESPLDYIRELVINPVGGELWICGPLGDGAQKPGGLYKYDGDSWISLATSDYQFTNVRNIVFDPNAQDVDTQQIWIAANQDGVLKTENGGKKWTSLLSSGGTNAIALNPQQPQVIYAGTGSPAGLKKTMDGGGNWQPVNEGMTGIVPISLDINPNNPAVVYSCYSSTYGSQNGGSAWQQLSDGCGHIVVDPADPNHVITGLSIADNGWDFDREFAIPRPPDRDEATYQMVMTARNAKANKWLMGVGYLDNGKPSFNYDGGGRIYISDDGENWSWIDSIFECPPTGFGFDQIDENIMYATTSGMRGGVNCGEATILRSDDGGQTWHPSTNGLPPDIGGVIAVEPELPYRIYLASGGYLGVSSDQGVTWEETNSPTNSYIASLLYLSGEPSVLYAGTGEGLFRSLDGAQTWQRAQGNLGKFEIWSLAGVATEDGRHIVYAATIGGVEEADEFTSSGLRESSDALVNAGVYRLTTVFPPLFKIYLPLLGN